MSASSPDSNTQPSGGSSHEQIVRSSSVIGAAQLINYVVGLVRIKVVAVLLGPSGVGLVGLYVSTIGFVGTLTKLGLGESGVREVAAAAADNQNGRERLLQTAVVLKRLCWYTGIIGWALTVIFAWPLSLWIFESSSYIVPLAILGSVVLIESLSSNYSAVLRGLRKIADLARVQILSGIVTTGLALLLYWWLGESGIIPVIIVTALVTLGTSWFYARRLGLPKVQVSFAFFAETSRSLLRLGALFTFVTVLSAIVGLAIRAVITRELGLDANGYYQAATVLTALLGGLMIQAMATDLYPRLTASIHDSTTVQRLVNEQIQTGILIAAPLLCGLVAFRQMAIELVYSEAFGPAVALVPWLLGGVLLQVIIVPMEFVARAKAHVGWLSTTQTITHLAHLFFVIILISKWGLMAAGYASFIALAIQTALSYAAAFSIVGFRFKAASLKKFSIGASFFVLPLLADAIQSEMIVLFLKILCVGLCCAWAARELARLLGGWARLRDCLPIARKQAKG